MNIFDNSNIFITNIQRFSLHDGPGIRTTVFLKGCMLRCPWCSNPENLSSDFQPFIKEGITGIYGQYKSSDELYKEVMKDNAFYKGELDNFCITSSKDIARLPGGVTFSGGECLLQMEALEPLMEQLHKAHIHMAAETSLFAPEKQLSIALQYIDFFYVDIKILDEYRCKSVLKGNLKQYFRNLNRLLVSGKPVVFRIPIISGYTDDDENFRKVIDLIKGCLDKGKRADIDSSTKNSIECLKSNILKVELIKEHNLGIAKWNSLAACNDEYIVPQYRGISDEKLKMYSAQLRKDVGIPVEICKI